jgi:hypothetical protein
LGTDEKGEPIYEVKETYRQFLKEAKQALGEHYLSFNPVGAQGIEQANTSAADVPAAPALKPPVKSPIKPSVSTASFTPFMRTFPKPRRGTEAPAPAKSIRG